MQKIFSLFAAVLFAGSIFAADELLFSQTYPGSPSTFTNSYTSSYTLTTGDYTLTYANINNGQQTNKWEALRCGRKSDPSVATVTTGSIATPITKVSINFTAAKAAKTNELYLLVASDADFTSPTKISKTIATGTIDFAIAEPAANQYYRIVIDMIKDGSSNGFNQFDSIAFCQHKDVAVEDPVIKGDVDFFEEVEVSITCETDGAKIYYTLDESEPTASSTEYTTAFKLNETKIVKAIAIKGDDKSSIVEKKFTKHQVFASIEALVEADLETGELVKVSFEDVKIDSVFTAKSGAKLGIYLHVLDKSEAKGIEIYFSSPIPSTWDAGGSVSGTIVGEWKLYGSQWEIVPTSDFEWTDLTYKEAPTGLFDTDASVKATKAIKNGQIIIEKNGVKYNVLGTRL